MDERDSQNRIEEIFTKAREVPQTELESFLAQECGNDAKLKAAVEKLLRVNERLKFEERNLPNSSSAGTADASRERQAGAADRNLLFGIIALQMNFINREALVRAMNQWVLQKTTPIEDILVSNNDIDGSAKALLVALVAKHLEHHSQRPDESLKTLSSIGELKQALRNIKDSYLSQSLLYLGSGSSSESPTISLGDQSSLGGRFRILRPHREGGLGSVSIAMDSELNREVALKEVLPKYSHFGPVHDRLRIEAEITGGLEHPGIVPVYGLGNSDDGRPFYCMRFIKGDSLKEAIQSFQNQKRTLNETARNLKLRSLLRRFIDVCDAVSYAHSRSVLHRDLKPGNIMLGKYGETLVVDWGLAKAGTAQPTPASTEFPIVPKSGSTAAPTMAGSAIGTPEYMSPEQAEGRIDELGPATDVYSLGATFFCLLTGQPPIDGNQVSEKLEKVRQGKFPRPSELDNSIPRPLEAVCLKAMAKLPENRYDSPAGMSDDIERWLADERVSAYPEPWLARAARTLRKNRTAAIALSAATAMAIVGLIGMNLVSRSKNIEIQAKNTQIESANSELKIVNEELSESKDAIKENYRSFRSLTAKLIQKAESDLSQTPETIKVREWLTSQTLELFRKFESENENADNEQFIDSEDSKIWLAKLYRYEANAIRNSNRVDESIKNYEIATSILRSVVADNPDSAPGIGFLSENLRDYANTISLTGKTELAIKMSEEALELSGKLLAKYPDSVNCQRLEATNLIDAAGLMADIDATKSALYTDRAIQLSRPINEGENVIPNDARTIIFALMRKSFLDRKSAAIDKAKESADEAIVWAREQLKKRDTRASRHMLARTLLERSRVAIALEEFDDDATKTVSEAVDIWQKLNSDYSEFKSYRKRLVEALYESGNIRSQTDDFGDANGIFRVALEQANALLEEDIENSASLELFGDVCFNFARHETKNNNRERAMELANEAVEKFEAAIEAQPLSQTLAEKLNDACELLRENEE